MARDPNWLHNFKRDVYSQTGEDGVIEQLLDLLKNRDRWCVEFGAWDGQHLSNTRSLIENFGYRAVLIEADSERFSALQAFHAENADVFTINSVVGFNVTNGLDAILKDTNVPIDFDFLSVDIDGNDFHVWSAMEIYRPKIICFEFNPTIPSECNFVQPADPEISQGSSLNAMVVLGKAKGYELASALQFNAFFIRADLFHLLEIEDNSMATLRTDLSQITYIFQGYDGHIFVRGNRWILWHGLGFSEAKMQVIPSVLQKYPDNYRWYQKLMFLIFKRWHRLRQ